MPTKRFALAATTLALVGACSSTKTVAPGPEACNEGSILLSVACGQNVSSDEDVKVILTRSSDGKERTYDQSLSCDRPRTIQVTLDEYEVGASFRAQVTGAEGEVLFDGTRDLPETCLYWSVTASRGEPDSNEKKDAGVVAPSDGGDMSGKDASPDVREVVVEAGVKLGQGMACSKNEHCATEFCIDGVCCESSCAGTCRACSKSRTGKPDGDCANVADGEDPDSECAASDKSECGSNGFCDGAGSCRKWDPQTQCAAAACTAEGARPAAFCDGQGKCSESPIQKCNEYACTNGACNRECQSDADCASGVQCVNKLCGGKRANGDACTTGDECSTGRCVDKVCCGSDCNGLCEACVAAKTGMPDGTCAAVKEGEDPDSECASETQNKCGRTGVCDGARKCAVQPAGTQCAAAQCTNGKARPALVCNGSGNCLTVDETACGNFKCGTDKCINPCKTDNDCVASAYCDGGVCYPRRAKGASCSKDAECVSGFVCSDEGVCCNSKCSSACSSCKQSVTGKANGECNAMPTATRDNRCASQAASTCGTTGLCDAAGQCAKHPDGTECVAAACSSDGLKEIKPRTCNGTGTCRATVESSCGNGKCLSSSKACSSKCSNDNDCAPGAACIGMTCGGKLPRGAKGCESNSQCADGLTCTEGLCCESACTGGCESCLNTKTGAEDGLCRAIKNDLDPKSSGLCAAAPLCGQTGKCNGNKGCQIAANGTQCLAPVCTADGFSVVDASFCNGQSMSCPAASPPKDCGNYKCRSGACLTQCNDDSDCDKKYLRCDAQKKCVARKIEVAYKAGDLPTNGAVVLVVENTMYIYHVNGHMSLPAGVKWASGDLIVPNDGWFDGAALPVKPPFSYGYYSLPLEPTGIGNQILGHSVTLQEYFIEAGAGSYASFDLMHPAIKAIWADLDPSPFHGTTAALDAAWLIPFQNTDGNSFQRLDVVRGTRVFSIDHALKYRVDVSVAPGTWKSTELSTDPTWTATNAPFQGSTASLDSAFSVKGRRPTDFLSLVVFRGTTYFVYVYSTGTWTKGDFLATPVPFGNGVTMDLRTTGGPFAE